MSLQYPTTQHGLHHVGSVQTVHTVGSDDLVLHAVDGIGVEIVSEEVVVIEAQLGQVLKQELDSVPAHLAALMVKVKVDVLDFLGKRSRQRLNSLLVCILHRLLVAALVDQVDQVVVAVELDLLFKVLGGGVLGRPGRDGQVGLVLQVVNLGPVHGHRASGLEERKELVVGGQEDLLGFVEVSHVSVLVDTTTEVPGTSTGP